MANFLASAFAAGAAGAVGGAVGSAAGARLGQRKRGVRILSLLSIVPLGIIVFIIALILNAPGTLAGVPLGTIAIVALWRGIYTEFTDHTEGGEPQRYWMWRRPWWLAIVVALIVGFNILLSLSDVGMATGGFVTWIILQAVPVATFVRAVLIVVQYFIARRAAREHSPEQSIAEATPPANSAPGFHDNREVQGN